MESKKIRRSNIIGTLSFGIFVMSLVLITFGCGQKSSNNNSGGTFGYGGYTTGRVGYGGNGVVSKSAAAMENNGRYMILLEAATPTQQQNGYYSGPAIFDGELRVIQPIACPTSYGSVGLNVGRYTLKPLTNSASGYLDANMMTNVTLLLDGPNTQAIVTIPYSVIFQTNVCGMPGMMGSMNIVSINQINCGLNTGFTDMVPTNYCGY